MNSPITAETLIYTDYAVDADMTVEQVMAGCRTKGCKSVPVINNASDRTPIGFVALDRLQYLLSTRFGFALYQNKKIQSIMETLFLMVDKHSDLSDVVTDALNRSLETLYDDIIVTDQGMYSGLISVKQLMVAQMEKIFSQSRHIDHQHQHLKVAQHQIEHGEIRYKKLFENSCSGQAVIDPDGMMVKVNRRLADLLRASEHQIENNVFFQSLVHPDDWPRLSVIFIDLERHYSTGQFIRHSPETLHEIKIKTQNGEWLTIEILCQYLVSPRQFLISVIDITEKKMMEEKILQTEKMSAVGTLVAGISHELNNQITPILGYCDLMLNQTNDLPEIQKKRLQTISRSASSAANIVNSLLRYARPKPLQVKPVNINDLIRENLQLLIYHKQYAGTELILDLKPDLPSGSVDEYQFGQVLLNLFINALQAMDQGNGRLHISTYCVKDSILISVEDNGKGIAPENINKIFEPFFTTKAPGQGTGLGLSIVYTIIKAHNGDIRVSSVPGKGTIFTISIPVHKDSSQGVSDAQFVQSFSAARTDIKKVMLIEDHETVRRATSDMLRQYFDFDLFEAENGNRAIESLLTHHDYDLIVSDIRMPECDGFQFYEWLRSNRVELCKKIIF